jgi:hypothetical protein
MPLVIATIIAVCLVAILGVVAFRQPARRWERSISLLAFLASLATLIIATWQNQIAAGEASSSAQSAKDSALAAAQGVHIEQAPALVINCHMGAEGIEDTLVPLIPNTRVQMQVDQPWHREQMYEYETCIVRNFGRLPALGAQLPITYEFDRVLEPGKSVALGTKTQFVNISGIAPQSSYTVWIENKSVRVNATVYTPQSILFFEPSLPDRRIKYVFPRSYKYSSTTLNRAHVPPGSLNNPFLP